MTGALQLLDRAQEAGIDDVGIGALFGLYDWRYEVMGLIRHTNHLEACYNVGPHTISFPRIKDALSLHINGQYETKDEEFKKLVAILRLAVPYTGLILTAREAPDVRREAMQYGVSQIDGGTKLELGSYSDTKNEKQILTVNNLRLMMLVRWPKWLMSFLRTIICLLSAHRVTGWVALVNISWSFPCPDS